MSPRTPTIDRPDIEDRVRAALAARARSTVVEVPERYDPVAPEQSLVPRPRSRRIALVAAAVAAVAIGLAALAVGRAGEDELGPSTDGTSDGPAPGTAVHGPTGSRWFVLMLPDILPGSSHRESTPATPGGRPDLQAFRTAEGFDGPAVWLERGGSSFGAGEGATQVTVHGHPAFVRQDGEVVTLAWPGADPAMADRFHVFAVHLSVDEVVAFADGLQARDGGGWQATVLPGGLAEVTREAGALPASEHAEWDYAGPDGTNYELFVDPGGPELFEDRAREHAASGGTISAISVDGRPGMVVETESETVALWRPTDGTVADFRTSLDRNGTLAAMAALQPVSEATWVRHVNGPPSVGAGG